MTDLTDEEQEIIGECLRAAADGPFVPDIDFQTLFGLYREEVRAVADRFPDVGEDKNTRVAINNSLNNLTGYPHRKEAEWGDWISVSRHEVLRVFRKWKSARPKPW